MSASATRKRTAGKSSRSYRAKTRVAREEEDGKQNQKTRAGRVSPPAYDDVLSDEYEYGWRGDEEEGRARSAKSRGRRGRHTSRPEFGEVTVLQTDCCGPTASLRRSQVAQLAHVGTQAAFEAVLRSPQKVKRRRLRWTLGVWLLFCVVTTIVVAVTGGFQSGGLVLIFFLSLAFSAWWAFCAAWFCICSQAAIREMEAAAAENGIDERVEFHIEKEHRAPAKVVITYPVDSAYSAYSAYSASSEYSY